MSVSHARVMNLSFVLNAWRWPAFALIASLSMLGAAHAFESFGNMFPCELCLRQRDVYWAASAMAGTGLILWSLRPGRRFLIALNVLLGMVFITGAIVAGYHVLVEFGVFETGCSGGGPVDIMNIDMDNLNKPMAVGNCGEVPWSMLGISMAGWNALISAGLSGMSFIAARMTQMQPRFA